MPKRTLFTNITPLPPQVSREVAIAMLHNHDEMIELNPLVIEHHPIKTPRDAPADEFLDCVWQELTDKISYLPGVKGKVSYKACFHDLPNGLQTHIYAPLGLDIREKWSIGGSLPGEPPEARELGVDVPRQGLYLREDGDMRCNMMMSSFVRKNLDNAHKVLVERILKKAELVEEHVQSMSAYPQTPQGLGPASPGRFQPGSHMSNSRLINGQIQGRPLSPQMLAPQEHGWQNMGGHPAFRPDDKASTNSDHSSRASMYTLPQYQQQRMSYSGPQQPQQPQQYAPQPAPQRQFVAELPGSTYHTGHLAPQSNYSTPPPDNRMSMVSELTGSDRTPHIGGYSDRSSMLSDIPGHGGHQRYASHDHGPDSRSEVSGSDRFSMVSELPLNQVNGHPSAGK